MTFNQTLQSKLKTNLRFTGFYQTSISLYDAEGKEIFQINLFTIIPGNQPSKLWVTILISGSKLMQCVGHDMFTFINHFFSCDFIFFPSFTVAEYVSFCTKQSSVFNDDVDFISCNQTVAEIWPVTIHPRWILLCWCVFLFLALRFYVEGTENCSFECYF